MRIRVLVFVGIVTIVFLQGVIVAMLLDSSFGHYEGFEGRLRVLEEKFQVREIPKINNTTVRSMYVTDGEITIHKLEKLLKED